MLNKLQAIEALRSALEVVLEEDVHNISENMRLFEDFHMDSTTMLETLLVLEESLGFDVDPEELDVNDFLTVKSYSDFLIGICANRDADTDTSLKIA